MHKHLLLIIVASAIMIFPSYGQLKNESNNTPQVVSSVATKVTGLPKTITIRTALQPTQDNFQQWFKSQYIKTTGSGIVEIKKFKDQLGIVHTKYQQHYKGLIVKGGVITSHGTSFKVESVSGAFLPDLNLSADASITEQSAYKFAIDHVDAERYYWEDEEGGVRPVGTLVFVNVSTDGSFIFKLAYMIDIYASQPLSRAWIYVDANTGEVVSVNNRIHHTDVEGTANTLFRGTRTLTTDSIGTNSYRLRETGRGNGIETYDLNNGTSYGSAVDFTDADNVWDVTENQDNAAYDAHWGAEQTYDYYLEKHGRDSYDGAGAVIKSYVHYSTNYFNAFWNGSVMTYGDGNSTSYPLTSIDVISHEITHAVTENTADLVYSYESGALNESFSDIFGILIDFYADSSYANYFMGEELYRDGTSMIRNMQDPKSEGDPDTYQGENWNGTSSDNGGVHTNSGVQNYWFYLLAEGGSGTNDNGTSYNINPIGLDKAGAICYRSLSVYLSTNSQYADARDYSIQSALDLYGSCSDEVIAVTNAWNAVGVGAAYSDAVIANFSSPTFSCSVPSDIQFTNQSTNGTDFIWDFGDGGSDTASNPSHTYSTAGLYTVELIVSGSASCGSSDTIVKTNYITIEDGGAPRSPDCAPGTQNATFNNMGIEQFVFGDINSTTPDTINRYVDLACSFGTSVIEGTIVAITVLTASSYNENVKAWIDLNNDGDFTSSEEIYSSENIRRTHEGNIMIPGGGEIGVPLRLRVMSDYYPNSYSDACQTLVYGHYEDYSITIDSNANAPIANFSALDPVVSIGESIDLQDSTLNVPTSWHWTISKAGSSVIYTDQHPTVSLSSGIYDVRLIVSNAYGDDTLLREDYLQVIQAINMCGIDSTNERSGVLYDDGGDGNYSNGRNCYLLINPGCASSIEFEMLEFNTESGFDYIRVYDGESTSDPLLINASGTSIPSTVVATSGKLYIYWRTDGSVTRSGFKAQWLATIPSDTGTVADFSFDNNNPPLNYPVALTDLSDNNPIMWNWNFNDEGSSTAQNPTFPFPTSGTKQIRLIADNCYGQDTITKTLTVQDSAGITLSRDSIYIEITTCDTSAQIDLTISSTGIGDLFAHIKEVGSASWLSFPNDSLILATSTDSTITINFNGAGLNNGRYLSEIIVYSNDQAKSSTSIPIVFNVNGSAVASLSKTCMDYDTIVQYTSMVESFYIFNTGCDTLQITSVTNNDTVFSYDASLYTYVAPEDSLLVSVTFSSDYIDSYNDSLAIQTEIGLFKVCLEGVTLGAPSIEINPDSINVTINNCDDSTTTSIVINNVGITDLYWEIDSALSSNSTVVGKRNVLSWIYRSNMGASYSNTIAALRSNYDNIEITESNASDSSDLETGLNTTDILLIPEFQNAVSSDAFEQYSGALQRFLENGGTIIVCGTQLSYITDMGLFAGNYLGNLNNGTSIDNLVPEHKIMKDVPATFPSKIYTRLWDFTDGSVILAKYSSQYFAIAHKEVGSGSVTYVGFTFNDTSTAAGIILGNVVANSNGRSIPDWLTLSDTVGTIEASDSSSIDFAFKSEGLSTGTYTTEVILTSNDPINGSITIPVVLNVNGVAEMSFASSCVDFDSIMQHTTKDEGVWINNDGCDSLVISNVSSVTEKYTVTPNNFIIPAFDSLLITVTFNADTVGRIADSLVFTTNIGTHQLCVTGYATEAPIIELNPESFDVTIADCGDSVTYPLWVANVGGSTLNWEFDKLRLGGSGSSATGVTKVLSWTYKTDYGQEYTNAKNAIIANFSNVDFVESNTGDASVLANNLFNKDVLFIPEFEYAAAADNYAQYEDVLLSYVSNGGTIVICGNSASFRTYMVDMGLFQGTLQGSISTGTLSNVAPEHEMMEGLPATFSAENATIYWNFTDGTIPLATYNSYTAFGYKEVGSGSIIYIGYDYFNSNDNAGKIIGNSIKYGKVNSIPSWLTLSDSLGSTEASDSTRVNFTFNSTGLIVGTYTANVKLASNDPLKDSLSIPVIFHVEGNPEMTFSTNCVDFDTVMQYTSENLNVWIYNDGCDTLTINGTSSESGDYTIASDTFTVMPFDSLLLAITFTPESILGEIEDTLLFATNIGTRRLCVTGFAAGAPEIDLLTDSISVNIAACNTTTTEHLIFSNTGMAELEYSIVANGSAWLSISPMSGNVDSSGTDTLQVSFDSKRLSQGTYATTLRIQSNDPRTPDEYVTVQMNVAGNVCPDFIVMQSDCSAIVQFEDASVNNPTSLEWVFEDGEVLNGDSVTYDFETAGFHQVKLIACNSLGCDSIIKTIEIISAEGPVFATCEPVTSGYCCSMGITNFTFNTIDNTSADASEGYEDNTCTEITSITFGSTYAITVTTGTQYNEHVRVWLDYNGDGSFEDDEIVYESLNTRTNHNGTFQFNDPSILLNTPLRMRIGSDYYNNAVPNGCSSVQYGQYEDYTVMVEPDTVPPIASMVVNITDNCEGYIACNDSSYNASSWLWNFGDGNTSTLANPTHQYTTGGNYEVELIVSNPYGSDTTTASINLDKFTVTINAIDTTSMKEDVTFSTNIINTSSVLWDFGDDYLSRNEVAEHAYDTVGLYMVTVEVTVGECSSTASKSIVVVEDDINPDARCKNITVSLDEYGEATIRASQVDDGSSDDGGIDSMTVSPSTFDCSNIGVNTVTLTVTDNSGKTSTCTAIVTIEDTIAPIVICKDITVTLDFNGRVTITPSQINNGSNDACGIDSISVSPSSFTCSNVGMNTVTLTVTDTSGNVATYTSTVTVEDLLKPVAICKDITVNLDSTGTVSISASQIDNGSNDVCGIDSISVFPSVFDCSNVGTNTVTFTVIDNSGNVDTCIAVVTVNDTINPMAICQDITVQLDSSGNISISPSQINNGSNDNCGIDSLSLSKTSFSCTDIGANTVTLTVTDNSGKTSTCTATVTIEDTIAPIVICKDITVTLDSNGRATITPSQIDNGSNDACGIDSISVSPSSFTCSNVGMNTIMLTVTDTSGNVATCTSTVTVEDLLKPVAICKDITVNLDSTGTVSISASQIDNGSIDVCGIDSMSVFPSIFDCSNVGTNTVTFTVIDNSGNIDTCIAVVTVNDTINPMAICQDITVQLDSSGNISISPSQINNGSNDNCGIDSLSLSKTSFSCTDIGINLVTLTVTDSEGNTSTCTANVTVQDLLKPVAICKDMTVNLDSTGNVSINAGQIDNGSHDACGIDSISVSPSSFTCSNMGTNIVTLTVMDNNGNSETCVAVVTVNDTINPTAICQDITVQLDESGNVSINAAQVDNGSNDECGIATLTLSKTSFTCSDVGSNLVTLTVRDNNANTSTCTTTVIVKDLINPTALCKNITVQLDSNGRATITPSQIDNGSNDICGIDSLSISKKSFTCNDIGSNTVILTVVDNNGNSAMCIAEVAIEDDVNPIAICQDITIQLDSTGNASITADLVDNGSNDNCGIASIAVSPESFNCADVGANTVTLTVTDITGNSSTCTSTVFVENVTNPTAICKDITVQLDAGGIATITASQVDNGSESACGIDSISVSPRIFDCSNVGANTVTLTVTDVDGNSSTCTSIVIIEDVGKPTAICQDITVILDSTGNVSIIASQIDNGSNDACGIDSISISPSTFTCSNVGTNTVTLTVMDNNGNSETCVAVVTVNDTINPTAICQNINVYLDAFGSATITANDIDNGSHANCGSVSLATSITSFDCSNIGNNNAVLTVTDATNNNSTTCTAIVTVIDTLSPIAVCNNITVYLDSNATATITASDLDGGSSDNCGIAGLSIDVNNFDCNAVGDNTILLTVTDSAGNFSTCVAAVIVVDTITPTPDIASLPDVIGQCSASVTAPTAMTNCGNIITGTTTDSTSYYTQGSHTIGWTFTDGNGNTVQQSQVLIVSNTVSPLPLSDTLKTIYNLTCLGGVTEWSYPMATDMCSGDTIYGTTEIALPINEIGVKTVVWTYTDMQGNITTQSQLVTIELDTKAPVPTEEELPDAADSCKLNLVAPTAIDDCDGVIVGTTEDPLTYYIPGAYEVTWSFTDNFGNVSTQSQKVWLVGGDDCVTGINSTIEQVDALNVNVYPNPTNGRIIIAKLNLENEEVRIVVHDISGRSIIETIIPSYQEEVSINLTARAAGMYFIYVSTDTETIVKKVIKY